jgi:DNA-binding transcriptional regulator YhcF (GntR family)
MMAALPILTVVTDDVVPPYEQLRRQLAYLISSGTLSAGERLPPLRQLAGDLGLAVGTVARTYRELEADGLISSRRGGGTRVASLPSGLADEHRQQQLAEHAADYVVKARLLGARNNAIMEAVAKAIAESLPQPRDDGPESRH